MALSNNTICIIGNSDDIKNIAFEFWEYFPDKISSVTSVSEYDISSNRLVIRFQTMWSSCTNELESISSRYPKVYIMVSNIGEYFEFMTDAEYGEDNNVLNLNEENAAEWLKGYVFKGDKDLTDHVVSHKIIEAMIASMFEVPIPAVYIKHNPLYYNEGWMENFPGSSVLYTRDINGHYRFRMEGREELYMTAITLKSTEFIVWLEDESDE
jgi:hypothetical protein